MSGSWEPKVAPREIRAYCAGFLDGEGCVRVQKQHERKSGHIYYKIAIALYNTNRNVLEFIQRLYGGSLQGEDHRYTKTLYHLQLMTKQAYLFLMDVREFSIVKTRQIENAIRFYEYQKSVGSPKGSKKGYGFGQRGIESKLGLTQENLGIYEAYFMQAKALNQFGSKKN